MWKLGLTCFQPGSAAFAEGVEGLLESVEVVVPGALDEFGDTEVFQGGEAVEVFRFGSMPESAEDGDFGVGAAGVAEACAELLYRWGQLFGIVRHREPAVAVARGAGKGVGRCAANPDPGFSGVRSEDEGLAV